MESVRSSNNRPASYPAHQYALPVLITLLLGLGLTLLNFFLYQHDFASRILLYLGEKALLVYDGNPPRLENMGFTNPPFPLFFVLLVKNPFVATAFMGSIVATTILMVLYRKYRQKCISFTLFGLLFIYVTLSPLSLFLFSQQMPTSILIALLLLIYHHLYRYCRENISYDLFMFGLLSVLIFVTDFQAILLIPLFTFSLVTKTIGTSPVRSITILITGLFPMISVSLAWCYLNWLFLGDPFHFISYWHTALEPLSSSRDTIIQSQTIAGTLRAGVRLCLKNGFLLLPYFVLCIWLIISSKKVKCCVTKSIILAPLFLLCIQLFTNFTEVNHYFFLFFVATAVSIRIHNHEHMQGSVFSHLFTISVLISLGMSFWLPYHHLSSEEQLFSQILMGQQVKGNLTQYRDLIAELEPAERILLDDTVNYPLVFLTNDPKRFVLPYEYEFNMVLAAPDHFVRYLVASDLASRDKVYGRYPMAALGYVPKFSLRGQFGNLYLYEISERNDNVPPGN